MRLLIVVDVYPPEISSAALLIQELAHGLEVAGDEVFVATTYPRDYLSRDVQSDNLEEISKDGKVTIIRTRTLPLKKVKFVIRGVSQIFLPFLIFRKVKKYIKGDLDGVIVYSPPLTLAITGKLVKKKYNSKFMLNLWDIFPQNAIDLGILKNKLAIGLFESIEKFAYRTADIVTYHSENGRQFLIDNKGVPSGKIFFLPHWADFSSYGKKQSRDFRKEYGLENKFIYLFAGTMGPAQGLDFLIKVSDRVKDIKEAVFLLVGDGMEKEKIIESVKKIGLKNVIVKDLVSKDDYPDLVRSVDAGVVCLSNKNKTPFMPGKFLGYMAAGKPILAFMNKESDGFGVIEKSRCGFAAESGDIVHAEKVTRELYNLGKNKLNEMGEKGRIYARKNLSLDSAIKKIKQLLA